MLHTPVRPPSADADSLLSVVAVPAARGRVVVEVVGGVDPFTAPLLELCLQSQAGRTGLRVLVVDLGRVTHLGAAGVSVLAQANQRCRGRGARLELRSSDRPGVRRLLHLAGLADVIAPDPTEPVAPRTRGARTPARPRLRPRRAPTRRPRHVCR